MHGIAALPRAAQGEFPEAGATSQEAPAWARTSGSRTAIQFAALAAAALAAAGCHEPGILQVAAQHPVWAEPGVQPIGPGAADALLSLGRLDDAEAPWRIARNEPLSTAGNLRSRRPGEPEDAWSLRAARAAFAAFEAGLRHTSGLGLPLEEARLRLDYADALLAAGQAASARAHYSAAAGLLEPMRAMPCLERALAGVAKLAASAPRRPRLRGRPPRRSERSARRSAPLPISSPKACPTGISPRGSR